jgi:plastocyanin
MTSGGAVVRKGLLGLTGLAVAAVAACGGDSGTGNNNPPPSAVTINLVGTGLPTFSPAVDTLAAGGIVTWQWDANTHDVTSWGSPAFISIASHTGVQAPQTTFPNAGTYHFVCTNHGTNPTPSTCTGMCGTLVVQ